MDPREQPLPEHLADAQQEAESIQQHIAALNPQNPELADQAELIAGEAEQLHEEMKRLSLSASTDPASVHKP